MKNKISIFILLLSMIYCSLKDAGSNITDLLSETEFALVLFTDRGCEKCKKWETTLKEVIPTLPDLLNMKNITNTSFLNFYKVDCFTNNQFIDEYNIQNFPSLKLIRKRFKIFSEYDKINLTPAGLASFIKSKIIRNINTINDINQYHTATNDNNILLVFCDYKFPAVINIVTQNNSKDAKLNIIYNTVNYYDDIALFSTSNSTLMKQIECKTNDVLMLKKFDKQKVKYDKVLTIEEFKIWIETYSQPLIKDYSHNNFNLILGSGKPIIAYIYKKEVDIAIYQIYFKQALSYRDKVLFFKSNIEYSKFFSDMFGMALKANYVIGLRPIIEDGKLIKLNKYLLSGDIKELTNFIENFLNNSFDKIYYISDSSKAKSNDIVHFTRNNYEALIKDNYLLYTHTGDINNQVLYI